MTPTADGHQTTAEKIRALESRIAELEAENKQLHDSETQAWKEVAALRGLGREEGKQTWR